MADTVLQVIYKVKGDDQVKRANKSITEGYDKQQKSLGNLVKNYAKYAAAAAGVVAVGKKLFDFQKENIRLAGIQEDAERQLAQTIQSTGGAAGYTSTELKRMASELQGVTKFGDEATIKGQSLLLTFTNIGRDVFPMATETMLDMSQALGQDMKSSAIQLGKALNDPITGVTALQRVGVSFTDQQKEQIQTLVESGQTMEAQKLILAELSREFGGQAKAAAETYTGQIEQLGNAYGDLREQLGFALRLTGDQIKGTQGLVEQATGYLIVFNKLREEQEKGNITTLERIEFTKALIMQGVDATEVLDAFAAQEIAAEEAALKLNTRLHDMNQYYRDQAILANMAAEESRALTDARVAARGVDEEFNDKLLQINAAQSNYNERLRDGIVVSRGLSEAMGETIAPGEEMVGVIERIQERLGALGNRHDFLLNLSVRGLEGLQQAINQASGFNADDAPYPTDAFGNPISTPQTTDPYALPSGFGDNGGIAAPAPNTSQSNPVYASGTDGWQMVPGSSGSPYRVTLHGGELFNVIPQGRSQQPGQVVNNNQTYIWNVNTASFNPESAGRSAAAFSTGGI